MVDACNLQYEEVIKNTSSCIFLACFFKNLISPYSSPQPTNEKFFVNSFLKKNHAYVKYIMLQSMYVILKNNLLNSKPKCIKIIYLSSLYK